MSRQSASKKKPGKLRPQVISPRRLFLKFRVRPLVRMPKSVMFAKLRHMVGTGEVAEDIEVAYMSYDHRVGKKLTAGTRLSPDDQEELEKFYNVLLAMDKGAFDYDRAEQGRVRLERPDA